ncbi:unnamed protein product [Linum trigynum]|uniref:Uncharacterized protein n=1 Tax=Linum trigynum TaxID=586398 RepID=A0AAV2FMR7_9ROSI
MTDLRTSTVETSQTSNSDIKQLASGEFQSLSRGRDALLQPFPLHLLLGDWLLLLGRQGLLCIHVERVIPNKERQDDAADNQQHYQSRVQSFSFHILSLLVIANGKQ